MSAPALELEGVARRFGRRWVLRGVDLVVQPGEVVAVSGRNGSGKTTLLRIAATAIAPTRGAAQVFGHSLSRNRASARPLVGLLAHEAGLYDDLTAEENLEFSRRMAGLPADRDALRAALEEVGLSAEAGERVRGYSAGMRRRLALARLLLRPPRLLLLDEPYASFDADGIRLVNGFAARIASESGAVLVATHDTARGRPVLTRAVRIEEGRLIAEPARGDGN